jgi:hypothetical protein
VTPISRTAERSSRYARRSRKPAIDSSGNGARLRRSSLMLGHAPCRVSATWGGIPANRLDGRAGGPRPISGALPVALSGLTAHAGAPAVGGLLLAGWICDGVVGSFRGSHASYPLALARLSVALAVPAITPYFCGQRTPTVLSRFSMLK